VAIAVPFSSPAQVAYCKELFFMQQINKAGPAIKIAAGIPI
jgi:hypothetical protein